MNFGNMDELEQLRESYQEFLEVADRYEKTLERLNQKLKELTQSYQEFYELEEVAATDIKE